MCVNPGMRRLASLLLVACGLTAALAAPGAQAAPPPIKHVWIIQLENKSYDQAFVDNVANQYLWKTLPAAGQVLRQYHGTGHASLDNYISQISGQAPNPLTQADCPLYVDVLPGIMGTDGQVLGTGCVYPPKARTLVDQLEAKGLTWKGYMQDIGNDPAREPATCGNPTLNRPDRTQSAAAADQYAARHNPFVYFHSILDVPGRCAAHVGALPPLADDLKSVASTPNFSWITPNLCDDGHDATPCAGVNTKGTKEGDLIAADAFLARWVPEIMRSPAFRKDGLLLVTFDESGISDSISCCMEPAGLNTPAPGISGPGGGRTGAVALSPYIQPGSVSDVPYNHYSLLKSLEQLYGIDEYLGYANMGGLVPFGADVYNRPDGGATTMPGPIRPGDAGSTGTARKLRVSARLDRPRTVAQLRRRLAGAGLRVRVKLTGSDRALNGVRLRLMRRVGQGRTVTVATGPAARTLRHGTGILRIRLSAARRARLRPGTYVLVAEVVHEHGVIARSRVSFVVRAR
ncbi:MAG: phosphoesterase [Solirubrobacterales bacterium]|nr:phosphoesterase [Solirubrobacterales bacterium]